jgi:hypothetical protein
MTMNKRRSLFVTGVLLSALVLLGPSAALAEPPAMPGETTFLVDTGPDFGELRVRWAKVVANDADGDGEIDGDGETGAATGYRIRYEAAGVKPAMASLTVAADSMDVGDVDMAVISGLKNDTAYLVEISAFNMDGFSEPTETKLKTTLNAPAPSAIASLTLTAGDMRILAEWTEADGRGVDITGYDVMYRTTGTAYKPWPHGSALRMAELTGLKNATEYEIRVRAKSVGGDGGWSPEKKATPMAGAGTPTPTPALPVFGAFALGAGLLAAGRRRLRRRQQLLNS